MSAENKGGDPGGSPVVRAYPGRPRSFDYGEACRRHAAGEKVKALAEEFGVSEHSIRVAVNDEYRLRQRALSRSWALAQKRPCSSCGATIWGHTSETGFCRACIGKQRRVAEHGTYGAYKRGCHCSICRAYMTDAKKAYRERHKVPCANCGTPTSPAGKEGRCTPSDRPPLCRPCSHAFRRAA